MTSYSLMAERPKSSSSTNVFVVRKLNPGTWCHSTTIQMEKVMVGLGIEPGTFHFCSGCFTTELPNNNHRYVTS